MANNLSVTVLTPNGRRNVVKCGPNTTILQILEQTCTKHGFTADEYDLTHHNHILDVSNTMRFSGLPNNAFLEMAEAKKARKESEVILGLQLENGERIMGTFSPSTDLHTILSSLAPTEAAPEQNPVLIYMRREVYGEDALKATNLKSLGLTSGRAIIRLLHRTPEQLKMQANVSAPLISKPKVVEEISFNTSSVLSSTKLNEQVESVTENKTEVDDSKNNESIPSSTPTVDSNSILNETFMSASSNKNDQKEEKMDTGESFSLSTSNDITKMETDISSLVQSKTEDTFNHSRLDDEIIVLGERNALVFSQNMASQLPYEDMPDDFYDLSVNEVRKLFSELTQRREDIENVPLQTSALKDLEDNKKIISRLHDYKKVVLRVSFPDRTVLQGTFKPLDTVETVMRFVKDYLRNPDEPFDLYITPPKQVLKPEMTLVNADCVPSALVYFGPRVSESELSSIANRQYLRDDIMSKLTSPEAATFSASKSRGISTDHPMSEVNHPSGSSNASTSASSNLNKKIDRSQPFSVPGPSRSKDCKVPKWFKPT